MINTQQELILSLLSIPGMPRRVTKLLIEFSAFEPATVTATFFMTDKLGGFDGEINTKRFILTELPDTL